MSSVRGRDVILCMCVVVMVMMEFGRSAYTSLSRAAGRCPRCFHLFYIILLHTNIIGQPCSKTVLKLHTFLRVLV